MEAVYKCEHDTHVAAIDTKNAKCCECRAISYFRDDQSNTWSGIGSFEDFIRMETPPEPDHTIASLLSKYGSLRRVLDAYWTANMTKSEERVVESFIPPDQLIGMKPL